MTPEARRTSAVPIPPTGVPADTGAFSASLRAENLPPHAASCISGPSVGCRTPEFNIEPEDVLLPPGDPLKIIRREPQIPYPLHTHSFAELVLITSGTGGHRVEDGLVPVGAGDVFVIRGEKAHGYEKLKDLYLINVLFQPSLLEYPMQDLTRLAGFHALFSLEPQWRDGGETVHLHLDAGRLDAALTLVERIESELRVREEGYRFMAAAHFLRLVGELSRWYSGASHPGARRLFRIGKALSLMEHRLEGPITSEELVSLTGLSISTLNRAFHRAVGLSPLAYHMRLRLRRAGEVLRSTDLSITETAGRCGFDDANYFARCFKKTMGCSPREYRERN